MSTLRGTVILGVIAVAAILFFDSVSMAICDGSYDLTVEISSGIDDSVSGISYLCVNNDEMAEAVLRAADTEIPLMSHRATKDPFTVNVGISYRRSGLGRTWGDVQQFSHIVVVLHRDNGSRDTYCVAIPRREKSRRVVVDKASAS